MTISDNSGGDLASRLSSARALLRALWPEATERPQGQMLLYAAGEDGPAVLRLIVDPPNLLLHFADGAALPDPSGLFRGQGRRGRYLCLRDPAIGDDRDVRALIVAATRS